MSSPPYRAVSVYHGFPQLGIDPRRHTWCTVSAADRLLEPGSVAERKAAEHWTRQLGGVGSTRLGPDWRWTASGRVVCSRAYVETWILRPMNVPTDDEIALALVDFPRNVPPPTASLFWETVHSLGVLETLVGEDHKGQAAKIWKAIRAGIRDPPARDSSDEAVLYFTDVFISQLGDDPSRPPTTQPLLVPGGHGSSQLVPMRRSFRTDITRRSVHEMAMKIMHSLFGSQARSTAAALPPYGEAVAILVACEALFPCKPDQDDASCSQWQASRPHAQSLDATFPELALPTRLLSWMRGAVTEGETNLWPIQVWASRAVMAALSTSGMAGVRIEGSALHTAQDVRDLEAKAMHRGRILAARAWFGTADDRARADLCKKIYVTGTGWRTKWQHNAGQCVSEVVAGGAFADMVCCLTAYGCMSHRRLLFWHALCRLGELCGVPATRWLPRDSSDATPGMPDVFVHDGLSLAGDIRCREQAIERKS